MAKHYSKSATIFFNFFIATLLPVFSFTQNYSAGLYHNLKICPDGTVQSWGRNDYGQLGNGTTAPDANYTGTPAKEQVIGLTNIISVAAGYTHSIALKNDGTVWTWGHNNAGQLGDGTTVTKLTPAQVPGLSNVIAVKAGSSFSLALKSDGSVMAWGGNGGQLGDGSTTTRLAPVFVSGLTNVSAIAAGHQHSLALKNDGTVWAWGYNYNGQLGDNTFAVNFSTGLIPVQVHGPDNVGFLTNISAINVGISHSVALKNDGTAWSWGANNNRQLGDGSNIERHTPVQIHGINDIGFTTEIIAIEGASNNSLLLKNDGTVLVTGNGISTPTKVQGLTNIIFIGTRGEHFLAIKSDTSIWVWGKNDRLQTGLPNLTPGVVQINSPTQLFGLCCPTPTPDIQINGGIISSAFCGGSSLTASGAASFVWSPFSGLNTTTGATVIADPISPTTYTVVGTTNGCSYQTSLVVNPAPTIIITPSLSHICIGNASDLEVTGADTYLWSPADGLNATTESNTTVNPTTTTTYIVTGTINGCNNTGEVVIEVNTTLPTITITASDTSVCLGNSSDLTASGADSYEWSPGDELSSTTDETVTAYPTATTTFIVTGTTLGCSSTQSVVVTLKPTPTLTTTPGFRCGTGTVTLGAVASAGTLRWYPDLNSATILGIGASFTTPVLSVSKKYYVSATNNGCVSTPREEVLATINQFKTPTIAIGIASGTNPTNLGSPLTFSTTATFGGTAPNYQWQVNGVNAGTNTPAYTTTTLANNDVVSCVMTSSYVCPNPLTVTSNSITISVFTPPNVIISSTTSTMCIGNSINLTASGADTYIWSPSTGLNATTGSSVIANPTATTTYSVIGTDGNGSTALATKTITINNVSAAITSPSFTICKGKSATLTASGGTAYSWNTGATTPTIVVAPTTTRGYTVTVVNNGCTATATSTVVVNSVATPYVFIYHPYEANPFCDGSSITFTAIPINGGTNPFYQWKVDNINVGTNSPSFTTSSLKNKDKVSLVMTTSAMCVTTPFATSNTITMKEKENAKQSVDIAITAGSNPTCPGNLIEFKATPTNGGYLPLYQWKVDGINVGPNSSTPTYVTSALTHGDQVTCKMTSTCPINKKPESTKITILVDPCRPQKTSAEPASSNMEMNTNENTLQIFPSPFTSQTVLQSNLSFENATVTIYNSHGQLSRQIKNVNGSSIIIQRDNLPSGIYFISIMDKNNASTVKKMIISE